MTGMKFKDGAVPILFDRSHSRVGFVVVGVLMLILFGWGSFFELQGAVVVQGVVKVEGNRKSLQHVDGGIVKEILVSDGDKVERGQVVMRLDDTQARAMATSLRSQIDLLEAHKARLLAERTGADKIVFSEELLARANDPLVAEVLAIHTNIFKSRRTTTAGQKAILKQRVAEEKEQIRAINSQMVSMRTQEKLLKEELEGTKELFEKGYAPKVKVLAERRMLAQMEGQIGEYEGSIARIRQTIGETEMQIHQLENERASEADKDLSEVGSRTLELRERLRVALDTLAHIEIVTPDDGYVVGLTMHTSGGVIVKGEKIMDIIPTGVRLVVEVNIKPEEINEVHVGAQAEVHFIPYKTTTYPKIMGQITTLSADRLTDPRTGQNYYQATVDVSKDDLKAAPDIVPLPGMPVEVFIPTLKRTPLQLLVYPLVSGISHSFRER